MKNGFLRFGIFILIFYFLFAGLYYASGFLIPLIFVAGLISLLAGQVKNISKDLPMIQQKLTILFERIQAWATETFSIPSHADKSSIIV